MRVNQLQMDWKIAVTIVLSTLLLVVRYYNEFFNKYIDGMIFYFFVPVLIILLVYRENPKNYGLTFGDWKAGLLITGVSVVILTLLMLIIARGTAFKEYYSSLYSSLGETIGLTGIDLFGWEFLFRGFLLFSLYRACGPYAIILQAVPFTIAHFGKPQLETLSCIFGGTAFGYIAWRTRSFLYPFIIHWYLGVLTVLITSGKFG